MYFLLAGWGGDGEDGGMPQNRYLAPWRRAAIAACPATAEQEHPEVLAALEGKPAIYHCVSRVVDRAFRLGPKEKERFVGRLRVLEAFCQVRVLTYCVMSNHFHVLVEVPERPSADPTDGELLDHLAILYRSQRLAEIRWELEHHRKQGNHEAAEALRQRFLRRMWDLSVFMRELKQGFSRWFNRCNERRGYLWEERFKSVLVEDGHATCVVAAYIDLNPVRAGIVATPGDYRWSGFGEAVAGNRKAREGLRQVLLERELGRSGPRRALRDVADWDEVMTDYQGMMAGDHAARTEGPGQGHALVRSGTTKGSRLSEADLLRYRIRHFVDGLVVGSREFVDRVFQLTRSRFGARRKTGGRRMPRVATALHTLRALKTPGHDGSSP